jgi:5-formyltetrahydrofolate cyclo-ligase
MTLPSDSLAQLKQRLRAEMRARRMTQTRDHALAFKQLADVFNTEVKLAPNSVIAAYYAFRHEMDPALLVDSLRAQGHPIALPAIVGKQMPLTFRLYAPGDTLVANPIDVLEPLPDAPAVEPDVLLVPLLAFDRHLNRLGYGGGFYDRTLAALRARKNLRAIGIAYHMQEVAEVPVGPLDIRLDAVVTELNIF